jgi:hypothetical protein
MLEKINDIANKLNDYIPHHNKLVTNVSLSSIGWHIQHSLQVLMAITIALKESKPKDYKRNFKIFWLLISFLGSIPRGKGQAPKSVLPMGEISIDSLQNSMNQTINLLMKLNNLSSKAFFVHPYFGTLRLKDAIHFMEIHTKHHLKIIQDIENSN